MLPWDPEAHDAIAPLLAARAERGLPAVGDIATRRTNSGLLFEVVSQRAGIPVQPVKVSLEDNVTGWDALLGGPDETDNVSIYAAPARATDLSDLPPAYIDVGGLDLWRFLRDL